MSGSQQHLKKTKIAQRAHIKLPAMKKITAKQKQIIDTHLNSAITGNWNHTTLRVGEQPLSEQQVIDGLKNGATFEGLHNEVEHRFVSMTSQLMANPKIFGHITGAYRKDYTKGFKAFLNSLNIQ